MGFAMWVRGQDNMGWSGEGIGYCLGGVQPTITRLHTGPKEPHTPLAPPDEDEHELMFIQPHDLDFVPESIYPKYIPLEDEHILPAEEQPLPSIVSPTAESPGYVAESDPEEDLEECKDDETNDGPVDYPIDGGDDGDDDDGDSSGEMTLTIRTRTRRTRRMRRRRST
nr:hypothetical protein [Tanacetum cinerariifolium]